MFRSSVLIHCHDTRTVAKKPWIVQAFANALEQASQTTPTTTHCMPFTYLVDQHKNCSLAPAIKGK